MRFDFVVSFSIGSEGYMLQRKLNLNAIGGMGILFLIGILNLPHTI